MFEFLVLWPIDEIQQFPSQSCKMMASWYPGSHIFYPRHEGLLFVLMNQENIILFAIFKPFVVSCIGYGNQGHQSASDSVIIGQFQNHSKFAEIAVF